VADDKDKEKLKSIRLELARLARTKKARTTQWTKQRPTDWRPEQIIDPGTGSFFTPDGSWEFVAEKLENDNIIVNQIVMRNPPGKKGYEFHVDTGKGVIYIKLEFGSGGKIIGRSFHD
jgi:hypothetical protein